MSTKNFDSFYYQFISSLKEKKRSSATILAYGKDIRQLIEFLSKEGKNSFLEVKTTDLENFLKKMNGKFTPKTISRKLNAIKTFYRFLLNQGILKENPSASISHPKYEIKPPRILSKLEYRALRDVCREDIRTSAIIEILLQTGMRIGELANLLIDDIKDNSLFIKPFENHESREIPLNKAAKAALNRYLSIRQNTKEKNVFITKTGKPLLIRNIRNTVDRYFKEAGIKDACLNDLRHTFIYHQLIAGAPLYLISKIVGHKRLTSTKRYLELVKNEVREKTKLEEL